MTLAMQPIYTQTSNGSSSLVTFNNIPQGYDTLVIKGSARTTAATIANAISIRFNGDSSSTNYSYMRLYGTGAAVSTDRNSNISYAVAGDAPGTSATASTFSNFEVTIPNYNSARFKGYFCDAVDENNATTTYQIFMGGSWRNTSAITSITLQEFGGNNFATGSTFTLYGLLGKRNQPKATGGHITRDLRYWYHAFKTTGSSTFIPNQDLSVEVLCVGGGGSGGAGFGAGGGGGGVVYGTTPVLRSGTSYSVTTGAGGVAQTTSNLQGNNGGSSSFGSFITALGGGGGGSSGLTGGPGKIGGSGGGGGGGPQTASYPLGYGSFPQGFNGATGTSTSGAGGGGAGGPAANPTTTLGGGGGNGTLMFSDFALATGTGVLVKTVGGVFTTEYSYYSAGAPGNGTGGMGPLGLGGPSIDANAPANTGASSSGDNTKAGGSGVVIVRYPL